MTNRARHNPHRAQSLAASVGWLLRAKAVALVIAGLVMSFVLDAAALFEGWLWLMLYGAANAILAYFILSRPLRGRFGSGGHPA